MNVESSAKVLREEKRVASPVVHYSGGLMGGLMNDPASFFEKNWQKGVTILLLVVAGIWFYNEYRTTMHLKNEEASQSFSKASTLLGAIISGDFSSAELRNVSETEVLERYLDEVKRLSTDFSETSYSSLGEVLSAAYAVSRVSSYESVAIDSEKLQAALDSLKVSFEKDPLTRISSELQILLYSRYMLASGVSGSASRDISEKARTHLKTLIEEGEIFPVEAAMSYLLSFEAGSEEFKNTFSLFDQLVERYPQIEDALSQECLRLGIAYQPPGFGDQREAAGEF